MPDSRGIDAERGVQPLFMAKNVSELRRLS